MCVHFRLFFPLSDTPLTCHPYLELDVGMRNIFMGFTFHNFDPRSPSVSIPYIYSCVNTCGAYCLGMAESLDEGGCMSTTAEVCMWRDKASIDKVSEIKFYVRHGNRLAY